jgi:hypothetical protein
LTRGRAAAAGLLLLAACARSAEPAPRLTIDWTPAPAVGRESVAEIRLTDAADDPLAGAQLRLDAFMPHPGMVPVTGLAVEEQGSGRYRARVTFTMAGDWIVRVQGARPDGRAIDLQQDVRGVRPVE